ncbi:MAG TPA: gamma-glutamyl-phosphate reductase, partial [Kiloniellaceae bacterium]|nr:gamma-glutamyl-phosphate reductase [Kiloniellaceae bacterium]HIP80754.1 gamma-glutamyl-phosphate reductase [Kiloniellaceae bacterium]
MVSAEAAPLHAGEQDQDLQQQMTALGQAARDAAADLALADPETKKRALRAAAAAIRARAAEIAAANA